MNDVKELLRETAFFAGRYGMPVKEGEDKVFSLVMDAYHLLKCKERNVAFDGPAQLAEEYLAKVEAMLSSAEGNAGTLPLYQKAYRAAQEMIVGGRRQSDLESYGYDMVYAFTQGAINSVMKQYVLKLGQMMHPEVRYYVYRLDPFTQKVTVEEATDEETEKLNGLDLFSIPDDPSKRTPEQTQAVEEAGNTYKAAFAFRAAYGIPDGFKPEQVENIVDFDTGEAGNHTKVRYLLYFKDFSIIQWDYNPFTRMSFSNLKQGEELWAFSFHVDLGLIGVEDSKIPPEIRKKIYNIDPGSMFSIQQLFLDLNTTALQDFPTIKGVSEDAMATLNSRFVNVYFKRLRELGDVIFGYSIKPASPGNKPYILTPKDFKFYISPYYENGKPSGKKNLYTLNYIVSCGGEIPYLKPFTWNWVDEAQYKTVNGAMAINKNRIYEFANREYQLLAERLLFVPYAKMEIPNPVQVKVSFGIHKDSETQVSFTDNSYHYERRDSSDDMFWPVWGNIEIKYSIDASVRTYQSKDDKAVLECRLDTKAWLHINVEGGVSEGTILNKTSYYMLKTSVDAYGDLKFEPSVNVVDNGTTFEISGWSEFLVGDFRGMVRDITNLINSYIEANMEFAQGLFIRKYNSNALWILPGNQSIIFKEPRFSDRADLTFDANYAKP